MLVKDVMTTEVRVAVAEEPVIDAVRLMFEGGFGAVPVVSRTDGFKGILRSWDVTGLVARDVDLNSTPVGDVVGGYTTVIPEQGLEVARQIWTNEGAELLAVTDNGALAGVLTYYDFEAYAVLSSVLGDRVQQVRTEIYPEDPMFFGQRGAYLLAGATALQWITTFLEEEHDGPVASILDMGCGHGRVTRMLRAAFPDAAISAADVDHGATDFCAHFFDATAIHLPQDGGSVDLGGPFDLIWMGSVLPWLPVERWPDLLDMLGRHLADGGLLVLSTLDWQNSSMLRQLGVPEGDLPGLQHDFEMQGFADQTGLETGGSTLMLTAPGWVRWIVNSSRHLRVVRQAPSSWATPQPREDIVACVRKGEDD
jgi:CBS domain-containing protein